MGLPSGQRTTVESLHHHLEALVGDWETLIKSKHTRAEVRGAASFQWIEGGAFLVYRAEVPGSPFPKSTSIIGPDEATGGFAMLYADERNVSRVYDMSLENGKWNLWRMSPDFPQRFEGKISNDGRTIEGAWEKAEDGKTWQHDFAITYRKLR